MFISVRSCLVAVAVVASLRGPEITRDTLKFYAKPASRKLCRFKANNKKYKYEGLSHLINCDQVQTIVKIVTKC